MSKRRFNYTQAHRDYSKQIGKGVSASRGLTESDMSGLLEVRADNTEQVLNAINQAKARALEKMGLVGEGYAKRLCPVDTGRLRNSITHVVDVGFGAVYIGTNVEYAEAVEMGTSKQKAQPYLRPAAQDHAKTYRAILEAELKKG